jgi:hypothetical protein
VLFLLNDVVLEFEAARLAPPAVAGHLARLPFQRVAELVREAFAENPRLPSASIAESQKLALMIALKHPEVNAALVLGPRQVCTVNEVSVQFASLAGELMFQLKGLQEQRRLTPGAVNAMVWSLTGQGRMAG